ncbi:unnamed protein product [Urochloa humidicola]
MRCLHLLHRRHRRYLPGEPRQRLGGRLQAAAWAAQARGAIGGKQHGSSATHGGAGPRGLLQYLWECMNLLKLLDTLPEDLSVVGHFQRKKGAEGFANGVHY